MKFLKSKTINFSVLLAVFGAAQLNLSALQNIISPAAYGWLSIGIAVAVAVLRAVTTKPLSEK